MHVTPGLVSKVLDHGSGMPKPAFLGSQGDDPTWRMHTRFRSIADGFSPHPLNVSFVADCVRRSEPILETPGTMFARTLDESKLGRNLCPLTASSERSIIRI